MLKSPLGGTAVNSRFRGMDLLELDRKMDQCYEDLKGLEARGDSGGVRVVVSDIAELEARWTSLCRYILEGRRF